MDHYLIVLTSNTDTKGHFRTKNILAFDLRDHSIQEAEIFTGSLKNDEFHLLKYEDKIILYGCDGHFRLVCLTIESFKRIPFFENTYS